jgi:hypothetical protein
MVVVVLAPMAMISAFLVARAGEQENAMVLECQGGVDQGRVPEMSIVEEHAAAQPRGITTR